MFILIMLRANAVSKMKKAKLQNIEISILDCGVPNKKPSRIVGGYETQIGEYPWQVC